MTDYFRLTKETQQWFTPLLPASKLHMLESDPACFAIGASVDGIACGILLCLTNGEEIYINYMAVSEGYQRKGIATGMVEYLCTNAYLYDNPVFADYIAEDPETDPIARLFRKIGSFSGDQLVGYRCYVEPDMFADMTEQIKMSTRVSQIRTLEELTEKQYRIVFNKLHNSGVLYLDPEESLLIDELCMCCFDEETNDCQAVAFAGYDGEDQRDLKLFYVWCDKGQGISMLRLLKAMQEKLISLGLDDRRLYIEPVTVEAERLIDKLLPRRVIAGHFYRAIWDMKL